MSVRAKFRCMEVGTAYSHTDQEGNDQFTCNVRLLPVYQDKRGGYNPPEENKLFYAATPSGEITMRVVNPDAAKQFTPGKCYYVDFTEAPE